MPADVFLPSMSDFLAGMSLYRTYSSMMPTESHERITAPMLCGSITFSRMTVRVGWRWLMTW